MPTGAAYQRARQILDPVGTAIEMAAAEFAAAKARLGDVPLAQAVDCYLRRHPTKMVPRTGAEVIQELLLTKAGDGLSETYVRHLRYDLEKFGSAFHCNIASVMGADVDAWLRELGVAPRTRSNLRNAIQTLFSFAVARNYLPKDHDELEAVAQVTDGDGEIEIFTLQELREILVQAGEAMMPLWPLGVRGHPARGDSTAGLAGHSVRCRDCGDSREEGEDGEPANSAAAAEPAGLAVAATATRGAGVCLPDCGGEIDDLVQRVNQARRAAWAETEHLTGQAMAGRLVHPVRMCLKRESPRQQRESRLSRERGGLCVEDAVASKGLS